MVELDLGKYSDKVRRDYLVPSSGWIGDIVIPLSRLTGLWDIFVLSALFILSWTMIRLSDRIIALIIARAFDTTIPLQHHLNPKVQNLHAAHCERYWSIWYIATAIEVGAYFLLHPDLFTMVTAFKTSAMVVLWHGRSADGTFWTTKVTSLSGASSRSSNGGSRAAPNKQDEWNELLKAAGYTSKARREMFKSLKGTKSDARQGRVTEWGKATGQQLKDQIKKYEDRATS